MTARIISTAVIAALLLTGTAFSATLPPDNGKSNAIQPTTPLTAQEAEAIALQHAGFTAQEVTSLRSHEDREKTVTEWDVEFRQGDWEYDYDLNAATGEILHWDKDYEPLPVTPAPTDAPAPTAPPATEAPQTRELTADEAEALALAHADLNFSQVKYLRSEYDYEDGTPEWDVEFRQGDWEYDYSVHAETGDIRRWEREYDPEKAAAKKTATSTSPTPTEAPAKSGRLTEAEVKAIALKHAGLSEKDVKGLRCEFDYDDGRPEYDVEFRSGGYEYEYEIHAESGKILKWDKEWDD